MCERQAGTEIEVTPEMVDRAIDCVLRHDANCDLAENLVIEIIECIGLVARPLGAPFPHGQSMLIDCAHR